MAGTFEQLRVEFLAETEDTLQQLQQDLNDLAEAADGRPLPEPVLDRVFRTTHSLKGVAGMFGLDSMSAVAHSMENVLDALRRGSVSLDGGLAELLHRGNDVLHRLLSVASAGHPDDPAAGRHVIDAIEEALRARTPETHAEACAVASALARLESQDQEAVQQAGRAGRSVVVVAASLPIEGFEIPFRELLEAIRAWGTVHGSMSDDPDRAQGTFAVRCVASGTDELFALMKRVGPLGGTVLLPETPAWLSPPSTEARDNASAPPPVRTEVANLEPKESQGPSLRVPVERVDRLMTQLGDLIQAKMALDETAQLILDAPKRTSPPMLRQSLRSLDRHIRILQMGILGVRLVSLGPLFRKLERTFREACRITGKEARFRTEGERLELDKGVVEPLAEAMIHLVRNAVDHGLEPADVREASGKDPVGIVRVTARAEGSFTTLEVADDGGGIPLGRVRERAEERGLLAPGAEIARGDLLDLLFRPGFTLKETASEISGRGVGLDAVRDTVARIGGTIDIVESEVGTSFRLRVPISLAVTQALEVECGGQAYFIPLSHVLRVLRPDDERTRRSGPEDGSDEPAPKPVPERSLMDILSRKPLETDGPAKSAVLLRLADRRLLLRVDRVGRRREIVVRSLGPLLPAVPAVSGCTELGDGRTVLILDPIDLFDAGCPVGAGA